MAFSGDAHFIPAHFVGAGQFKHLERAHWADSAGNWLPAPPQNPNAGFQQIHPAQAGFQQIHPAAPMRRVVLQGMRSNLIPNVYNPPSAAMATDTLNNLRDAVLQSLLSGARPY